MTDTTCPECGVACKLCRSYAEQCPKCGQIQFLFSQTEVPVVANDSTHERAISVTHEDLRAGRLNIYKLTGEEAADLVSEFDAVMADASRYKYLRSLTRKGLLQSFVGINAVDYITTFEGVDAFLDAMIEQETTDAHDA